MNIAEATARRLYTDGRKREAGTTDAAGTILSLGRRRVVRAAPSCGLISSKIVRACPLYAFILIGNGPSALFLTPTFQQSFQFSPRTPRPTLTAHHCQPTSRQRCEKLLRARNKPMPRSCQDLKRHSERGRSTSVKLRGDPDLRPRGLRLGNRNLDGLA